MLLLKYTTVKHLKYQGSIPVISRFDITCFRLVLTHVKVFTINKQVLMTSKTHFSYIQWTPLKRFTHIRFNYL